MINLTPHITRTDCDFCSRCDVFCKELKNGEFSCDVCLDDPECAGYDHENEERMKQIKNTCFEFFSAGFFSDRSKTVKENFNEYWQYGR